MNVYDIIMNVIKSNDKNIGLDFFKLFSTHLDKNNL